MAYLNPPFKFRPPAPANEPLLFQRGMEKVPVKKVQRTLIVRPGHIALFFLVIAAIFLGLAKVYGVLLGSRDLAVKRTEVIAQRDFVARDIKAMADPALLGNLLALDIERLQRLVESHPWVREARLRKVFPSEVRIEIKEREPAAVLKAGDTYLVVAEDGVVLEKLAGAPDGSLPLLVDDASFQQGYRDKLGLAWDCLKSLTADERSAVDSLDVSRPDSVGLTLKGQPTRLVLDGGRFARGLRDFIANKESWEGQNGPLDYVDLRFEDRVYIKALPQVPSKQLPAVQLAALSKPKAEVQ